MNIVHLRASTKYITQKIGKKKSRELKCYTRSNSVFTATITTKTKE